MSSTEVNNNPDFIIIKKLLDSTIKGSGKPNIYGTKDKSVATSHLKGNDTIKTLLIQLLSQYTMFVFWIHKNDVCFYMPKNLGRHFLNEFADYTKRYLRNEKRDTSKIQLIDRTQMTPFSDEAHIAEQLRDIIDEEIELSDTFLANAALIIYPAFFWFKIPEENKDFTELILRSIKSFLDALYFSAVIIDFDRFADYTLDCFNGGKMSLCDLLQTKKETELELSSKVKNMFLLNHNMCVINSYRKKQTKIIPMVDVKPTVPNRVSFLTTLQNALSIEASYGKYFNIYFDVPQMGPTEYNMEDYEKLDEGLHIGNNPRYGWLKHVPYMGSHISTVKTEVSEELLKDFQEKEIVHIFILELPEPEKTIEDTILVETFKNALPSTINVKKGTKVVQANFLEMRMCYNMAEIQHDDHTQGLLLVPPLFVNYRSFAEKPEYEVKEFDTLRDFKHKMMCFNSFSKEQEINAYFSTNEDSGPNKIVFFIQVPKEQTKDVNFLKNQEIIDNPLEIIIYHNIADIDTPDLRKRADIFTKSLYNECYQQYKVVSDLVPPVYYFAALDFKDIQKRFIYVAVGSGKLQGYDNHTVRLRLRPITDKTNKMTYFNFDELSLYESKTLKHANLIAAKAAFQTTKDLVPENDPWFERLYYYFDKVIMQSLLKFMWFAPVNKKQDTFREYLNCGFYGDDLPNWLLKRRKTWWTNLLNESIFQSRVHSKVHESDSSITDENFNELYPIACSSQIDVLDSYSNMNMFQLRERNFAEVVDREVYNFIIEIKYLLDALHVMYHTFNHHNTPLLPQVKLYYWWCKGSKTMKAYMTKLLASIHEMHLSDVFHHDLHSANIFYHFKGEHLTDDTTDFNFRFIDFGLADSYLGTLKHFQAIDNKRRNKNAKPIKYLEELYQTIPLIDQGEHASRLREIHSEKELRKNLEDLMMIELTRTIVPVSEEEIDVDDLVVNNYEYMRHDLFKLHYAYGNHRAFEMILTHIAREYLQMRWGTSNDAAKLDNYHYLFEHIITTWKQFLAMIYADSVLNTGRITYDYKPDVNEYQKALKQLGL
jgi:hypothetical protein